MPETSALPAHHHPAINASLNEKEKKWITEKALMAEHMISVSESTNTQLLRYVPPISRPKAGLLSHLSGWLSSAGKQINPRNEGEDEMAEIRRTGKELYQLAENCAFQREIRQNTSTAPALRLTGKAGLLIGAGLLADAVGSLSFRRVRAADNSNNSTGIYHAGGLPFFHQHDAQMANRPADYNADRHVSQYEPLPQPAARASPRRLTTSRPPDHDDVKKIAISDLICYETVGAGRMAHRIIVPCKKVSPVFWQHKPRTKPPRKYYYTKNQPDICRSMKFEEKCHKFHHAQKKKNKIFKNVVLNVGKTRCLCPPPCR
ncbi:hypothetical protein [Erwinia tasmaniensis]|uniref:Uncharacterized protein n=1 Tax=Erwinia tasmaniensis (strain DSM 17950 / CFBP 7177 / CIP 109463 / NCPPB 4357 / Et1/99) TaxID=465817 RepID=B2VIZ8_ERWT9|nr:hypothetical protein [Erwinia tasmaniensis]CAO96217.1 hypothetical protein ETA_11710 [Erwinia tasmaniensis Et1/99]